MTAHFDRFVSCVEFYCNYPSIKILVKSDLLIFYDTGITKWTETQGERGNRSQTETLCQWNCNAICVVYCNLNLNNIKCTSKFSRQISAVIKKRFTHSLSIQINTSNGSLYFVSQIKCETLLLIQNYRKTWQRSWQAWPTERSTYHLHSKKTNFNRLHGRPVNHLCIPTYIHTLHTYIHTYIHSSPVTGPEWPRGFQEVMVPRFHDNGTG